MASNPNAPLGPHAILVAVERLVVNDHHKAAVGWTWEDIRDSLIKVRTHQQEIEEPPHALFNADADASLIEELDSLLQMGDLKLVGRAGGEQQPYGLTLSPPYLPPWFRPEKVLDAVGELDGINAGGWTWEQIRDSLKDQYQPEKPLPPDFDTVLRTMLFVFHERGHLTITRGSANNGGPRHYKRRQAPALAELDPIDIPGHIWCYYLGFKLGVGGCLHDDSGSDEEDAGSLMANNPNAPPALWFGPRTVLQEIEWLFLRDWKKAGPGWTCEQIRDSLILRTHQPEQGLPHEGFDARLRATLATLNRRGYLIPWMGSVQPGYTLSNSPPSFPTWFRPEAVLQAVGELDKVNAGGSTWDDIKGYFIENIHDHALPPWLDSVLQTMLSVLGQRGHLRRGAGRPEYYTRRDAAATIGIPDDYLRCCYYVGHKLGRSRRLPDGALLIKSPRGEFCVGLRQRNVSASNPWNDDTAETKPLLASSHDAEEEMRLGSSSDEITRERGQARRKETDAGKQRRKQQRSRYLILRLCFSFFGHGIVFALSFIHGFGQETSGHDQEEETSKKWLRWGMMDVIVPLALLIVMIIIHIFYIDLEDISADKKTVKRCKIVNLATISFSKIVYFAISEAPAGANVTVRGIIAHAIAFLIDMVGAIYLYRNHSCYELDNI